MKYSEGDGFLHACIFLVSINLLCLICVSVSTLILNNYIRNIYQNIDVNNVDHDKENIFPPSCLYILQDLQADFSKYFIQNNSGSMNTFWNVQFTCDKYFEICMYDNKLFDGMQVFRTVKVFKDLTWEATYAGHKANCLSFLMPLPNKIASFPDFMKILKMVEFCKICEGVKNQAFSVLQANVHNLCGESIGRIEEVVEQDEKGNERHSLNRRSLTCEYFIDTPSSGALCQNCNVLRRNISVKLVRFNNILQQESERLAEPSKSKVNKRFLSNEEISERENDQKRRRITAEKRVKYWKFKAAEEKKMKHMAVDDGNDLMVMFKELDKVDEKNPDKEMFPDDPKLSLFWEMQRDVISKKSKKTAIRWHPL